MAPTLDCLDHIHIHVANRAQSEAWYARVLGLHRQPECEPWLAVQPQHPCLLYTSPSPRD